MANAPTPLEGNGETQSVREASNVIVRCIPHLAGAAWAAGSTHIFNRYREDIQALVTVFSQVVLPTGVFLKSVCKGSINLLLQATDLESLKELWQRYKSGQLKENIEKVMVSEELTALANGQQIEFVVEISEEEYNKACLDLIAQPKEALAVANAPTEISQVPPDEIRFWKLTSMLICGGTAIMRELFDCCLPPSVLRNNVLSTQAVKDKLQTLRGKKFLTNPQWNTLYPGSNSDQVRSKSFDITLLFKLFRELCNLKPPSTGWDYLPNHEDVSLSADLVRIKYYRNMVYARENGKMELSVDEFESYWTTIKDALMRIVKCYCSDVISGCSTVEDWEKAIDDLLDEGNGKSLIMNTEKQLVQLAKDKAKLVSEPAEHDEDEELNSRRDLIILENAKKGTQLQEKTQSVRKDNSTPVYGLPLKMTTFVGRDDTVSHITDHFIKHHKQIVVLLAPPGFGKSSVAIHVGHALRSLGTSVIFLSGRKKTSMVSICTSILKTLEPEFSISDDVLFQTTNHLLSLQHKTVLVLEDTDDIQNSESSEEFSSFIESLTGNAENLKLLLTTRKKIGNPLNVEPIILKPLDDTSSTEMLSAIIIQEKLKSKDDTAKRLANQCAGVPLLITFAGLLVRSGYDPVQLANDLQKKRYTVLKLEGNALLEYFMGAMRLFLGRSLKKELLISLVKLSHFASGFNVEDASIFFPNAVECQGKLCFLHENAVLQLDDARRYSLHPVIQTLCREEQEKMNCAEEGTQAMNRFTNYYFEVLEELHGRFVSKDFKVSLQRFHFVKMNIDQAFENALRKGTQEMKERCIDVFNSSINFLGKVLMPAESLKVYKKLHEEAKSMKDNKRMSECLVSLGFTHIWEVGHMGYSKEATEALEEAISLQNSLPKAIRQIEAHAHGLSKLGLCYYAKNKRDSSKGKELIGQAKELRHQLGNEVLLAAGYCDQANAALFCGEHERAITLLKDHCLPSYKKHLGDHPWVASTLNLISETYNAQGLRIDEAVYYAKKALAIREELLENHQDTAKSYFNLGQLFQQQQNYLEALGAFNKALLIRKKVLGEQHEITVKTTRALEDNQSKLLSMIQHGFPTNFSADQSN